MADLIKSALDHVGTWEYYSYSAAVTLIFVGILVLLLRRQPKQVVAYATENGKVCVARSAIKELVQTSCDQIDGITKPYCRIKSKGRQINLDVQIKIDSGCKMRIVEETLQRHMRKALSENLGIEKLGSINVMATGFKSARISTAPARRIEEEKRVVIESDPELQPEPEFLESQNSNPVLEKRDS